MIYIREFEIYETDGAFVADPLDMDGGTFGDDFEGAVKSACDWLRETVLDDLVHNRTVQGGKLNLNAKHGGRIVAVSVDCSIDDVPAVSAAQAARMLGVTRGRISQMCDAGLLTSFKQEGHRYVLRDSIEARLENFPNPNAADVLEG